MRARGEAKRGGKAGRQRRKRGGSSVLWNGPFQARCARPLPPAHAQPTPPDSQTPSFLSNPIAISRKARAKHTVTSPHLPTLHPPLLPTHAHSHPPLELFRRHSHRAGGSPHSPSPSSSPSHPPHRSPPSMPLFPSPSPPTCILILSCSNGTRTKQENPSASAAASMQGTAAELSQLSPRAADRLAVS